MKKTSIAKFLIAVMIVLAPIGIDRYLMARYHYYQNLVLTYECYPVFQSGVLKLRECAGDFDGDGIPGAVVLERGEPRTDEGKAVIVDGGRKLFYLPYFYESELALSTHLAVYDESGLTHLVVVDGMTHNPTLIAVFAWDGQQIAQVHPSKTGQEIIDSMRAEIGEIENWSDYAFFRKFLLFVYYFLVLIATLLYLKRTSIHAAIARLNRPPEI